MVLCVVYVWVYYLVGMNKSVYVGVNLDILRVCVCVSVCVCVRYCVCVWDIVCVCVYIDRYCLSLGQCSGVSLRTLMSKLYVTSPKVQGLWVLLSECVSVVGGRMFVFWIHIMGCWHMKGLTQMRKCNLRERLEPTTPKILSWCSYLWAVRDPRVASTLRVFFVSKLPDPNKCQSYSCRCRCPDANSCQLFLYRCQRPDTDTFLHRCQWPDANSWSIQYRCQVMNHIWKVSWVSMREWCQDKHWYPCH